MGFKFQLLPKRKKPSPSRKCTQHSHSLIHLKWIHCWNWNRASSRVCGFRICYQKQTLEKNTHFRTRYHVRTTLPPMCRTEENRREEKQYVLILTDVYYFFCCCFTFCLSCVSASHRIALHRCSQDSARVCVCAYVWQWLRTRVDFICFALNRFFQCFLVQTKNFASH